MIEESIIRLAEAVEKLAAALQSHQVATPVVATTGQTETPAPEPVKTRKAKALAAAPTETPEPAKPAKPATPAPTVADLRAMAQKILDAGAPDKLRELNKKYGCRPSECPPERVPEFAADLQAALNSLSAT